MRDLADTHYPDAERIRVVLDNLSTHTTGKLARAYPDVAKESKSL
jgi:hypothetical protein